MLIAQLRVAEKLDSGQAGMTTEKDDKGFLSFPLVGNHSLKIYNPPFTVWLQPDANRSAG